MELRTALGPALIATQGYSAPALIETVERARLLADHLGRSDYLLALLYGQRQVHIARAEHRLSLAQAEQIEKPGEVRNNLAVLLLGRYLRGFNHICLGEFLAASGLPEQCRDPGDPAHREVYSALTAEDPYASMLASLGVALMYLGRLNHGRARISEALAAARGHAHTLALVLGLACWAEMVAASPLEVQPRAEELTALSNEQGFPFWLALGLTYRGWAQTKLGQTQNGPTLIAEVLSMMRATGTILGQRFLGSNHIRRPRRACRTTCG